jgi:hypothetical protein
MGKMSNLNEDNGVISLKDRKTLVSINGKLNDGDQKFASVIDLGDIDRSRTKGADAAYRYLNGQPGEFRVVNPPAFSAIKVLIYSMFVFSAGGLATWFVVSI